MRARQDTTAFVAIGGLGGSGTRVVAEVLRKMGFYLGPLMNDQLDNLLFTLMFKQRAWFDTFPTDDAIDARIEIFAAAMRDGVGPVFDRLGAQQAEGFFKNSRGMGVTRAKYLAIKESENPDLAAFAGLAWKEPNTHVFLPQLVRRFEDLKYIHVIRNGLDMALSRNRQQLTYWGGHFGVLAEQGDTSPNTQLRYWLAANRRAVEVSRLMKPGCFLMLNYDDLCHDFESGVRVLEGFLERRLSAADIADLAGEIQPSSIGRFRDAPEGTFSAAERAAVQEFGFSVE